MLVNTHKDRDIGDIIGIKLHGDHEYIEIIGKLYSVSDEEFIRLSNPQKTMLQQDGKVGLIPYFMLSDTEHATDFYKHHVLAIFTPSNDAIDAYVKSTTNIELV